MESGEEIQKKATSITPSYRETFDLKHQRQRQRGIREEEPRYFLSTKFLLKEQTWGLRGKPWETGVQKNETPCQLFRHLYSEVEQKKETIITFTETHKLYKRFNNMRGVVRGTLEERWCYLGLTQLMSCRIVFNDLKTCFKCQTYFHKLEGVP